MEEIVYYNNLFDYYGILLTDIQKSYFKAYYCDNLSLKEISDEFNVSRNAISKCLKEVKEKLDCYENLLHLYSNKIKIENILSKEELIKIEEYI